jgi:hypothetical protein
MTPALPMILMGQAIAAMTPLPPEAGPEYAGGRAGIMAMLASLAAQEAERATAARAWENGAIRELLARAGAADASPPADDLSWSGLDAENARLRRALIAVHEATEAAGDTDLQRDILALYVAMAKARRLELGPS